jgi:hypothetical protein
MSTLAMIVPSSSVGKSVTRRGPCVGGDALRRQVTAARGERLREAADAVATHLCAGPVGVEEQHRRRVPVRQLGHQEAVRTDSAPTVAQVPRHAGELGAGDAGVGGIQQDEEVVAEGHGAW